MSGGGGRQDYFGGEKKPDRLRSEALNATQDAEEEARINAYLSQHLAQAERDADLIRERLDEVLLVLQGVLEGAERLLFGGSVAKRTFVDGLSDVDVLLLLNEDATRGDSPNQIRQAVAAALEEGLPAGEVRRVRVGDLAVTVEYRDATELQVLPAVRRGNDFAISNASGEGWATIRPRGFAKKLSDVNQKNGGRIVPIIKLAKKLISQYPDGRQLSGYHIESLAIEAFENYAGPRSIRGVLQGFFESAARRVLSPIRDSSGQSVHVDDYLGANGSIARRLRSDSLARTARRLASARTLDLWKQLME
jgi:hypothetical protein